MKKNGGQSIIGILIALAIFSLLSQAVLTIAATSYRFVSYNRARITARHLAQEKIEFIRNLPYDDIGTSGGIPSGTLSQVETIKRNGLNFSIRLTIIYFDDPFDNNAPNDLLPTDYKRVRVEVSWEGIENSNSNPVVLLTDISPKGVETTAGGGTLSVIVFDASGDPVSDATVHIVASSVTPAIDLTLLTPSNGRLIIPGAPACISCYQITVTKTGFSSESTHSTAEVANPAKPHQTIIIGQLTEISFSIDHTSTINLATKKGREDNFDNLGNVSFRLRGEKTIGTDASANPIYKYDQILTTESNGFLTISDMEWDSYYFSPNPLGSYDISGTQPLQPLILQPQESRAFAISLVANSSNSLLVSFVDQQENPIATTSATLSFGGNSTTKESGLIDNPDYGQVFFDNLSSDTYNLVATHSAFQTFTGSIPVSGDKSEKIILQPN